MADSSGLITICFSVVSAKEVLLFVFEVSFFTKDKEVLFDWVGTHPTSGPSGLFDSENQTVNLRSIVRLQSVQQSVQQLVQQSVQAAGAAVRTAVRAAADAACSAATISYFVDQGIYFNTNLVDNYNNPDSSTIFWSVCNATTCYTGEGTFAAFPMIQPTDTLKVCYDAYLYYGNAMEVCNQCDSMVYSQGNGQWVLYSSQGNTTGIEELMKHEGMNNIIYDMLGREVITPIKGVMYIRNNKKFIVVR